MARKRRPPPPPWLTKINFLLHYTFNACEAPFSLYAEMAKEPAWRTAVFLSAFDLVDFVKEIFRPYGLRSKRHGRKGRRSGRRGGGIPDLSELAAERTRAREWFGDRRYGLGTRVFYVFTDIAERVTWNLMLVELSTDLAYDTIIGVINEDDSKCPNIRMLAMHEENATVAWFGPEWKPVNVPYPHYERGIYCNNGRSVLLPEGNFDLIFGATFRSPTYPQEVGLRWRIEKNGKSEVVDEVFKRIEFDETIDLICYDQAEGPCAVYWEFYLLSGFLQMEKADVQIMQVAI